jgi:MFS family permease
MSAMRIAVLPAMVGQALTFALLPAVLPGIATYFGGGAKGEHSAQLAAVFPFLGLTVGALASGAVIRLLGPRNAVLVAAAALGAGGCVGLLAAGQTVLLIGCVLVGFGAAMLTSGLSEVTALSFEGSARTRIIGYQTAMADLAAAVLGLASAFIAERLGWRTPFGFYLIFGAVMLALASCAIRNLRPAPPAQKGDTRAVLRAWPIFLTAGLGFMLATTQGTQLPFLLAHNGIDTPGLRAIVMTITSALAVAASLFFGTTSARLGDATMMTLSAATGTAGFLIFGSWTHGFLIACIAGGLLGVSLGLFVPLLYAAVMRAVPPEASGQAVGFLNAAIFVGSFVNPIVLGPLRTIAGLSGQMSVLAGLTLLLGMAILSLTKSGRSKPLPARMES